ncbi:MAG: IS110 family transposase [Bacteroidia bacterium]|nr:MAG: IS110 family transposase [Bacteroidia bacterium]
MKNKRYIKVCGLDVHKDTVFCSIYDGNSFDEVKEFSTFTASIKQMADFLQQQGVKKVAMESTGIYWIPVWNILETYGFELILVNPYYIKQMPGKKSDIKDAQWIETLLHKDMLRGSLVPDKPIRELRAYSRKYVHLKEELTSVLTEMERLLEMSNIRITSLVSNLHSTTVLVVIQKILQQKDNGDELLGCIHGRILKREGTKVKMALEGYIQDHHRVLLKLAYEQYELLNQQLEELEQAMQNICETHYKEELERLKTIPGVKKQSAMQILAETGSDRKAFENSGKLTGWAGLRPRNDESAGKMKSTAITKGNKYLRRLIVQCGWAASRTKGSKFQEMFLRLCVRKSRKKALIAVARNLLTVIWNVLRYKQVYQPHKQPVISKEKLKKRLNYYKKQVERLEALTTSIVSINA